MRLRADLQRSRRRGQHAVGYGNLTARQSLASLSGCLQAKSVIAGIDTAIAHHNMTASIDVESVSIDSVMTVGSDVNAIYRHPFAPLQMYGPERRLDHPDVADAYTGAANKADGSRTRRHFTELALIVGSVTGGIGYLPTGNRIADSSLWLAPITDAFGTAVQGSRSRHRNILGIESPQQDFTFAGISRPYFTSESFIVGHFPTGINGGTGIQMQVDIAFQYDRRTQVIAGRHPYRSSTVGSAGIDCPLEGLGRKQRSIGNCAECSHIVHRSMSASGIQKQRNKQ